MQPTLIVNADDFGQSEGVNRGILRAHRDGIVTSASLMVRWPAAVHAAGNAGQLDLGLHIDLGEWACHDGLWRARYERVSMDDPRAVEAEVRFQLDEFRRLTGATPTHIDSHQHVHLHEPVFSVAKRLADELAVPLRACTANVRYCGSFYGQSDTGASCPAAIGVAALVQLLGELRSGITELCCHPGEDTELDSTYCRERFQEVDVLCHPEIREALETQGVRLITFAGVAQFAQLHFGPKAHL
jgi:chitin disaccharide deacetylase